MGPLHESPPRRNIRGVGLDWDDLKFVLALRRAGSLGGAARALKVEQSTASRRLTAIEAALGAQLVTRTPEGMQLSDAGLLAAELAQTIDEKLDELQRRIGGEDQRPEGLVRLSTTESLTPLLMRGLVPLRQAHPKIQVHLVVNSAPLDLVRREADLAVRLFREKSPTLIARKIGEIGWSIYGARALLERTGFILGPTLSGRILEGQPIIGYAGPTGRSVGAVWLAEHSRPEDVVLTGESVSSVTSAVRAGIGISVLPCFVVHGDDTLVRLTTEVVTHVEAFVVIPPDHRNTARVRLVMDAVAELFDRERVLLSGRS